MEERYNHYNDYIKKNYGERIQKITVDAGFTCPNRDGTVGNDGCIYCNNDSFAPTHIKKLPLMDQINHGINLCTKRYGVKKFFVYFQPFTNTYAPIQILEKLYLEALSHPKVLGLYIGTRPDCIDEAKINMISNLAKNRDITIEYGLESISNESLRKINRGHNFESYITALNLTKNKGIKIGTHIILGFPWEDENHWITTANTLSLLPIDFLKIHQLQIVKHTALEQTYQTNPFKLFSMKEYMNVVINFLEHLSSKIVIQRVCSEAPPHLLIAPKWNIPMSQFLKALSLELKNRNTFQGKHLTKFN